MIYDNKHNTSGPYHTIRTFSEIFRNSILKNSSSKTKNFKFFRIEFCKISEKSGCDHNRLISVF